MFIGRSNNIQTSKINDRENKILKAFETRAALEACEKDKLDSAENKRRVLKTVKRQSCTFVDVIRASRKKMFERALKRPEELHNITLERNRTAGRRLRNSFIEQIK